MAMSDSCNLQRFVDAQDGVYEGALEDLRAGRKTGHWMWFIFPQIRGLGHSVMANHYAIGSREEAEAYLRHPVLGRRLRECVRAATQVQGRSAQQIFGFPDELKFRSCLTLFLHATKDNAVFQEALEKYFGGVPDELTMQKLKG